MIKENNITYICPNCGADLQPSVLATNPPQSELFCPVCHWHRVTKDTDKWEIYLKEDEGSISFKGSIASANTNDDKESLFTRDGDESVCKLSKEELNQEKAKLSFVQDKVWEEMAEKNKRHRIPDFPLPNSVTFDEPSILVSPEEILKFYNDFMHKDKVDTAVKEWFRKKARECGWTTIDIKGSQALLSTVKIPGAGN